MQNTENVFKENKRGTTSAQKEFPRRTDGFAARNRKEDRREPGEFITLTFMLTTNQQPRVTYFPMRVRM